MTPDKLTREMVDALEPEHTVLRYPEHSPKCNDDNLAGGFTYHCSDKEWRCKRCCLLDILDGVLLEHSGIELHIEIYGLPGNIR